MSKAEPELRILLLEDVPTDAELVQRALRKGGLRFTARVVDACEPFRTALAAFRPDVVLSDYNLPDINGVEALRLALAHDPDLPVIAVTGALTDEAATELVRVGAKDYILKDRLARLPFAVQRVLIEAEQSRARRRAETEREQYLRFFRLSTDAMAIADPHGRFLRVNPAFTALTGYSDAELIAKPFIDFVHPEDRERTSKEMQLQISTRPSMNFENRYVRKDGSTVDLSWTAYFDKDEGVTYAAARDVTERNRTLEALRRSEERFRGIVETSADLIWETDLQGAYTYVSPRIRDWLGYEPDEVIGRSMLELLPAEEVEQIRGLIGQMMANPQPIEHVENVMVSKDDSRRVVVESSGVPIFGPDGVPIGYRGVDHDITERKAAEQRIRDDEVRYRSLVEQDLAGICVIDGQGRMAYVNPWFTRLLGYSPEEGLGRPFAEFVPASELEKLVRNFAVRLAGTEPAAQYETMLKRKDGGALEVLVHSARTIYAGEPAVIAVFVDITEQKKAQARLREDEARFQALTEQGLAGVYIADRLGKITYINGPFARTLGYEPEEVIGRAFLDFVTEESRPDVVRAFAEEAGGGAGRPQITFRLVGKDGRIRDVLAQGAFALIENQPAVIGVILDVTEQKKGEAKLREDEARFRALTEQDIAGVFILDQQGAAEFINPGFAAALGYKVEEVLGRSFGEFLAPDSLPANVQAFADLISGRLASTKQEGVLKRADGGRMPVLIHSAVSTIDGKPAIVGVLLDLTKQKEDERNLRRLNRTLQTLSAGNEALVRAGSEDELLGDMCRILVERGGYRMAWIGIPQKDAARTVAPVARFGHGVDYLDRVRISWSETDEHGRGIVGEAIRSARPQTTQNLASDVRMSPWQVEAAKLGFASGAALPLMDDGRVFGAVTIYSDEVDAFSEDELKLLRELASDLSFGIRAIRTHAEREAAVQRWRSGLVEMISAISGTMEMRDPYTAGHQHRVAQIAVAIAKELNLPEDQIQGINLAGIIHDIGKITVPSELLTKPGKLTPLEFQLIQTHAQSGYDVVKGVDFPWPIADAIHQHHERLDGSGYPQGLKADQIIEEAKILAVADVVEAMMSHRPYRPALGVDAALAEIEKNRGKLYDTAAAEACLKLFREQGFKLV